MKKYVDNNKASNARRRYMVVVGTLPKAKAKAFIKANPSFGIYGINLDTTVDIGVHVHMGSEQFAEKWYEWCRNKVATA